jgi:hypothetical protein
MKLDISAIRKRAEALRLGTYGGAGLNGLIDGLMRAAGDDCAALCDVLEQASIDGNVLCDRVEELGAALRDALRVADSANRTTDGSEALSAARAALNDAHDRPTVTPGTSNGTKGDPCP